MTLPGASTKGPRAVPEGGTVRHGGALVGLSSGVDSAVTGAVLLARGNEVYGGDLEMRRPSTHDEEALTPVPVTLQDRNTADVASHSPQRGLAPGRSIVAYHQVETLGGGGITMQSHVDTVSLWRSLGPH